MRHHWHRIGWLALVAAAAATAAEPRTEHTWALEPGEARPEATIEDAAWLAGSWSGTGFAGRFEETWNPPSAGTMVGLFKLFDENGISIYELMLITVENGTLVLKVRHFDAGFTAWEARDEYVTFRLVKKEPNALHFGGMSFYRRNADTIDGYVVMRTDDDVIEQHLSYRRRPAGGCAD